MTYRTRRNRVLCFVAFFVGTFIIYNCYTKWIGGNIVEPDQHYSGEELDWQARYNDKTKVILLYTTWFRRKVWKYTFTGTQLHTHFEECPGHKNCLATYNRTRLQTAHAVLFHGSDIELERNRYYPASKLIKLRQTVPKRQKWVYLSHEKPLADASIYAPYDGLFNWTATFSRRSNVFIPYVSYAKSSKPHGEKRNFAEGKTKQVVWAVSNCHLMREEYVLELQKYINVTVYGDCRKYFAKQENCQHYDAACQNEISKYKFYLAFENAFCQDYVTEKYWERIEHDTVPVVMGANYDKGLVIPGSYIDAGDFNSIKELAKYLKYLDANDAEYNKYFEYKSLYHVSSTSIFCGICNKLHSKEANKFTQIKLSKEYSRKQYCGLYKYKEDKFWKQILDSRNQNSAFGLFWAKSRLWFRKIRGALF